VRQSLAARLTVPLTLSAGLIIALGLLVDYRLSRAGIIQQLEDSARSSLANARELIDGMAAGVETPVRVLADLAARDPADAARLEPALEALVAGNRHIFGAALAVNPELVYNPAGYAPFVFRRGERIARTTLAGGPEPYWERDWFRAAARAGEPLWVEPYYDAGGGEVLMTTFSVPVYDAAASGRRFLGVITADIALAEFRRYLAGVDLGAHGFGFVLSRDGTILGAPRAELAVRPVATVMEPLDGRRWSALLELAAGAETVAAPVRCPGFDARCTVRLRRIEPTGWFIGAVYSEAEVLKPLRDYETRVVTVGVAMLVLIVLTATIVTRRLVAPIQALARASGAIARGHLGVELPRVRSDDEIGQLIRAFDAMRRDLGDYIDDLAVATASRSRLEGELAAARDIQLSMLPQHGSATLRQGSIALWASVRPARSVGGDLYSFHLQGDKLLFAVGDVSDKGVPAALFMARAISLIQQWEVQPGAVPPAVALHQLNAVLLEDNDNCMFLTLCLGVLDTRTLDLELALAGHAPPLYVDARGAEPVAVAGGPALGLNPDARFQGQVLRLAPGERLALYTDGLDEAFNPAGAMLGSEALARIFAERAGEPPPRAGESAIAAVDAFADGTPQADDMTLMIIDARPRGERATTRLAAGPGVAAAGLGWLQAQPLLAELGENCAQDLTVALEELLTNIEKYAELPAGCAVAITLEVRRDEAVLTLRDPGEPFNPLEEARRARLGVPSERAEIGGLGLHLLSGLTDEQHYSRDQAENVLTLVRYRQLSQDGLRQWN
jgi:sigma-B regulation protein RsbU (phosphoserine phosphatase)